MEFGRTQKWHVIWFQPKKKKTVIYKIKINEIFRWKWKINGFQTEWYTNCVYYKHIDTNENAYENLMSN